MTTAPLRAGVLGWIALLFIAIYSAPIRAKSQNDARSGEKMACTASRFNSPQLYGQWLLRLDGDAAPSSVVFDKHPEFDGAIRGRVLRRGVATPALLAGDASQGVLSLEESADGRNISGLWTGDVVDDSCGKEIRGVWTNTLDDSTRGFVLRRQAGW